MSESDALSAEALMRLILKAVHQMGWSVAVPNVGDDETVPGLIIGTDTYIDQMLDQLPDGLFEIYPKEEK